MPSAVWNGRQSVDEHGIEYPARGPEGIRACPRRAGIVSGGLVSRGSEAAKHLLSLSYECVILDEAHHAHHRNLDERRDGETADPNNLLAFMYKLAERTRSLLLATVPPVQLRLVEAWDLLDVLSRGDDSVLSNPYSRWRSAPDALALVMGSADLPVDEGERWEWVRNPLPPKTEHRDFEILRRRLNILDDQTIIPGDALLDLRQSDRARLGDLFPRLISDHNPFIRRIIRRTREQLEQQIDPETSEPLLKPIGVDLLGERDTDAVLRGIMCQLTAWSQ